MELLKDLASGNGSWISLLFIFAILPWFYLRYAFDTQKEYVDLAKNVFSNSSLSSADKRKLSEWSERSLHVFQLEWGLVCAIAVLILANFCSVMVVDMSALAKSSCVSAVKATATATEVKSSGPCDSIKLCLSLYSIAITLLIFFEILWARVAAIRRLRELYFDQALNRSSEPRASSASGRRTVRVKFVWHGLRLSKQK